MTQNQKPVRMCECPALPDVGINYPCVMTVDGRHPYMVQTTKPAKPAPRIVAECGCEIIGRRGDGTPLPKCGVMNFRYYGGRCKADEVSR